MKFLRQDITRYSKIGKSRRKLQKWRRPKGRHSKMRKQRKSYPASPSVGYATEKTQSGKINGKNVIMVYNLEDLKNANSSSIVILSSKIGARKKIEMIKLAEQKKIEIYNITKKQENKK